MNWDNIEIIRSRRRTMAVEIKSCGQVIVRAPLRAGNLTIRKFLAEHEGWIDKHIQKQKEAASKMPENKLTEEEIRELADRALKVIPERVAYYAPLVGVTYGRITIRNQKTRWGSCSVRGNLNFNCLLMLTPPEVVDSVVVHELCHRLEMNHSKAFYDNVLRVFPDYRKWDKWLKNNGNAIMSRML